MIGDHPLAENLPEPIDQLGRESDLRHEQQHLSALASTSAAKCI